MENQYEPCGTALEYGLADMWLWLCRVWALASLRFIDARAAAVSIAPRVRTVCFVILPFSSLMYEEIVFFTSGNLAILNR